MVPSLRMPPEESDQPVATDRGATTPNGPNVVDVIDARTGQLLLRDLRVIVAAEDQEEWLDFVEAARVR
jgi:hypothetical protein